MTRFARGARKGSVFLLASLSLLSCAERDEKPRRNVLLISIDSLRADHLSCYGYDRQTSPVLDRLAEQGVLFRNAIAETSWTLPSHMTMLTGLSSRVHGVTTDARRLAEDHVTLAEVLRDAGYHTCGIWSAPYLHPLFGFGQGFDEYEGVLGDLVYDRPRFDPREERFAEGRFRDMKNAISAVTTPEIVDRSIRFLKARAGEDRPFFLFLHLFDVHFDYIPPEDCWRRFDPDYEGDLDVTNFPFNDAIHPGMDPRDKEHLIARYDGEIYFVDRHLGRLFAALERMGLDADTIVMVTADHGDEFFEHGDKGHQKTLFDEVVKIPWIVRVPGVEGGRVIAEQVRHVDIMPTVLGLVGIPPPSQVMGENLAPAIEAGRAPRDLMAVSFLESPRVPQTSALRTRAWKLIASASGPAGARAVVYDLADDPLEQRPETAGSRLERALESLAAYRRVEETLRRTLQSAGASEVPEELRRQLEELGY